jgi:putative endonuclease
MSGDKPTRRGREAEDLIAKWLPSQGMCIVARNLRLGYLELDIVAREDKVIVVVEVRRRDAGSWTSGLSSINETKRMRIRRAGKRLWDRRYRHDASAERMRFDVASVSFSGEVPTIEYVRGAF